MADAGQAAVTAYIAASPKAIQPMLRELRAAIKSAVPEAEERISYRMPFYAYHGRLIYFAAHRNHVGMYPITGRERTLYEKELRPYLVEVATLHFPIGKPLPIGLIKRVVKERAKQNEEQAAGKRAKTSRRFTSP
jgi:uncharacterized protein YdhG (YjbR/CyaY superfamily)